MIVLAGDIGGTKVNLGLFEDPALRAHRRFTSADYHDLESICRSFLEDRDASLDAAAFGIAGPIVDGRSEATNLPWVIEQRSLSRLLDCPVRLLNDLESTAHGIPDLSADQICTLNEGREVAGGARAIIAAGTGLGQGYMVYDAAQERYLPHASEGGHTDFGPRSPEEIELLQFLTRRLGQSRSSASCLGWGSRASSTISPRRTATTSRKRFATRSHRASRRRLSPARRWTDRFRSASRRCDDSSIRTARRLAISR